MPIDIEEMMNEENIENDESSESPSEEFTFPSSLTLPISVTAEPHKPPITVQVHTEGSPAVKKHLIYCQTAPHAAKSLTLRLQHPKLIGDTHETPLQLPTGGTHAATLTAPALTESLQLHIKDNAFTHPATGPALPTYPYGFVADAATGAWQYNYVTFLAGHDAPHVTYLPPSKWKKLGDDHTFMSAPPKSLEDYVLEKWPAITLSHKEYPILKGVYKLNSVTSVSPTTYHANLTFQQMEIDQ